MHSTFLRPSDGGNRPGHVPWWAEGVSEPIGSLGRRYRFITRSGKDCVVVVKPNGRMKTYTYDYAGSGHPRAPKPVRRFGSPDDPHDTIEEALSALVLAGFDGEKMPMLIPEWIELRVASMTPNEITAALGLHDVDNSDPIIQTAYKALRDRAPVRWRRIALWAFEIDSVDQGFRLFARWDGETGERIPLPGEGESVPVES